MKSLIKAGAAAPLLLTAFASFYLLILTIAALVKRSAGTTPSKPASTRFAVLVPAHNEERLLPRLLESLRRQDYPQSHYSVFVVADNCTDRTAEIGSELDATVHERNDRSQVGKGYALRWLLERVHEEGIEVDAYAFIDSDCVVSPNFLSAMNAHLQAGEQAVQALYTAVDPFTTVPATLRNTALLLKHDVRARGKAALGLPCGLFGTGMVFSKEIIDGYGWDAYGLAEDAEYQMKLVKAGVHIAFARDAQVLGEMPDTLAGARGQNLRWESGRVSVALRQGPEVLRSAVKHRRWRSVDAVIEQALPPLSLIAAATGSLAIASAALKAPPWMLALAWANVAALTTHVIGGMLLCRAPARTYRAFLHAPLFIAWKCALYANALQHRARVWEPTRHADGASK